MSDPRTGHGMEHGAEHGSEHGGWDALAVGWALSALDPEDEERFAGHLQTCDRCTATVRESLYTVADLAYAVPDEEPPPALKSRLMAAVAADPRTADPRTAERSGADPRTAERSGADPRTAERSGADEEQWPLGAPHPGTPAYDPAAGWVTGPAYGATEPVGLDAAGPLAAGPVAPESVAPGSVGAGPVAPGPVAPESVAPGSVGAGPMAPGPVAAGPVGPDPVAGHRTVADDPRPDADRGRRRGRHSAEDVVIPFAPRRSRTRRFTVAASAAAMVALVAGMAVWNVQLRSDRDDLRKVVAQREAAIAQLTADGPATIAALTQTGKPEATRQATLVIRGNQVEILVESLGPRTGDDRYWLWRLNCGDVTSARPVQGFTVAQPEFSVRDIGSEPGLATATCFAISEEVGAATPTKPGTVVAVGQPG